MRRWCAAAALLAAVVMIAAGLAQSQNKAVMRKAETICLECVGIG